MMGTLLISGEAPYVNDDAAMANARAKISPTRSAPMKDRKDKTTRAPILAAGGIVLRGDRKPQIAVVQLRKLSAWVLPKGKLAASESVIAAARRELLEATGHRVSIHEFLGTLAYEAG